MTTCTLSSLFLRLRSLLCTFCCHRVTNRPIGNSGAHHPSLTGLCGFVLDCRCVKNGKKGEVGSPNQFHTSTALEATPARRQAAAASLLRCCGCLLRLETLLMRGSGKLLSFFGGDFALQQHPATTSHSESLIYGITSRNQELQQPDTHTERLICQKTCI